MLKKCCMAAVMSMFFVFFLIGCAKEEKSVIKPKEAIEEKEAENPDFKLKVVEMTKQEAERIQKNIFGAVKTCAEIVTRTSAQGEGRTVPTEEEVHQMVDVLAASGETASCGSYDYNMQNYKKLDRVLKKAQEGKEAAAEFYSVTADGGVRYYLLEFDDDKLVLSTANAWIDEELKPSLTHMEKIQVYKWEYTKKGWLIWEKALSKNMEMDMHVLYRVLPLDDSCREMNERYIQSVSYYSNNLFLIDWNAESVEKIVFNDLIDYLYMMENGKKIDPQIYSEGIPKEEFEALVLKYFNISASSLEAAAGYNTQNDTYPWAEMGRWNRVQQFQPFSEVVRCTENADGTRTLRVEAILPEAGLDCAMRHEVRMQEMESGRWMYLGNKIDMENSPSIPKFKARNSFDLPL